MALTIFFKQNDQVWESAGWDGGLEAGKHHARDQFEMLKEQHDLTHVEIRDEQDRLHFDYPRLLQRG